MAFLNSDEKLSPYCWRRCCGNRSRDAINGSGLCVECIAYFSDDTLPDPTRKFSPPYQEPTLPGVCLPYMVPVL